MQDNKGKEVCNNITHNNLAKTAAAKKLKPCNFTGEAKNLIIKNAICQKEELGEFNDKHKRVLITALRSTLFKTRNSHV